MALNKAYDSESVRRTVINEKDYAVFEWRQAAFSGY